MSRLRFKPVTGLPPLAIHTEIPITNKTGTWRSVRPVYDTKLAPCRHDCPAGEKIPAYFELVKKGHLTAAWELIRQDNPLPAVCGRVCYHPCEEACNRRHFDEALSINAIERFVGDYGLSTLPTASPCAGNSGKVAVVGSGPAGLSCAYQLTRMDYQVTVFEATSTPGGMLALGIPEYRLPRDVLRAEIALIEADGVSILTNTPIGPETPLSSLFEKGFQAIFLAIGAHRPITPAQIIVDGSNMLMAVDFLRQVNSSAKPTVGRRVVVVGGGNVAIDAARSAFRLGANEVTILYRRSREDMPAHKSEIIAAEAEGVRFDYLVNIMSVIKSGREMGFRCVRSSLGAKDANGRHAVANVPGSEFIVYADTMILATGQAPATEFFATEGLALNPDGTIKIDSTTMATSRPGVFAGGDATSGPARVVDAIAAGKRAAQSIQHILTGQNKCDHEETPTVVNYQSLNLDYFQPAPRVRQREVLTDHTFRESKATISSDDVASEVERCFSCGLCNGCDNCWLFCPDVAISRQGQDYRIDYDFCKGCGICVTECPRSAIRVEEEAK